MTGGDGGIGCAIVARLAAGGMRVVVGDLASAARDGTSSPSAPDAAALRVVLDVADEASVAQACAAIDRHFGRLDILVNSAGILGLVDGKRPLVETMSLDLWRRTLDVNLTGTFLACRGAIPLMRRHRWGRIVNIASRAARMSTGQGNSNYAASKAGLLGFTRVLAAEVGRDGITANCVAPSRVVTPMTLAATGSKEAFERSVRDTAVGRLAEPADIASVVAFVCSDDASFLTGTIFDVNGGSYMP